RRNRTMSSATMSRWLKWGFGSYRRSPDRRPRPVRRPPFVPQLLAFEGRIVPSTLTVLTNADSGPGTLRQAIADSQNGDQIVFDSSLHGQSITLTSGQLAVSKSLDIEGPGADELAVSGNHQSRVFSISGGVTVTIAGLTITDGLALGGAPALGGGILNVGS